MSAPYIPGNWYWTVAGDATRAWSSAAAAYVPAADPVFAAWLAGGGTPTAIDGEADLAAVLAAQFPAGWPPTLAQQAAAALAAGVTLTSASAPALNGLYAIDAAAQGRIGATSTYILVNGKFPGGLVALPWFDLAGAAHVFPATAAFQAFGTAVADHVAALLAVASTGAGPLPPATVSIP